jgi:hypothetical protein
MTLNVSAQANSRVTCRVVVRNELPRCPMCGEAIWEETAWRPFSRDGRALSTFQSKDS